MQEQAGQRFVCGAVDEHVQRFAQVQDNANGKDHDQRERDHVHRVGHVRLLQWGAERWHDAEQREVK